MLQTVKAHPLPFYWFLYDDGTPSDQHEPQRRPHEQDAMHQCKLLYADPYEFCGAIFLYAIG